jgi:lysophospholipase-2
MSLPFSTTRSGTTITLSPKNPALQSGLIVISHGLGDTAEGFADVAQMIAKQMPHLKIILPTAPTQPVSMNMGMPMPSWYDITGLDERSNENCKGIHDSKKTLMDILKEEHSNTNLSYERMVLMGFSQGGALSLFTGMQLEKEQKLAGIVVMSGYLPAKSQFKITGGLEDVPIMHFHGQSDPMVQVGMATRSQEVVKENGAKNYQLKTYPGLVHSVNEDEIRDVQAFLEKVLPDDEAFRITLKDPSEMTAKELKTAIRNAEIGSKAVGFMEKSEFVRLLQDHRNGKL